MKRMLGLAIPLAVIPAVVHAQANVTLYGSIDNGLSFANNVQGGQSWSLLQLGSFGNFSASYGTVVYQSLGSSSDFDASLRKSAC